MPTKIKISIGDTVEFTDVNGVVCFDTIEYIDANVIEGKQYDLTYIEFKIVKFTI